MSTRILSSLFLIPALWAAPALRSDMLVSTNWLADHLNDPKVVILHISKDRTGYDAGHIPGARYFPQAEMVIVRDGIPNELPPVADLKALFERAGVSDDSHVILYADTTILFATRAYFTLDYLGHGDRASLLDGGLDKWKAESRTLAKEATPVAAGHFTPQPKPELVMGIDGVKNLSQANSGTTAATLHAILLDVRPVDDFHGNRANAELSRTGHIPGAVNLFWGDTQVKGSTALKPEPELRKLYEDAGIKGDGPIVTYCNSGMQASQTYFTLKYLGYDTKLYDGSLSEWSAAKTTTVEK